MVYQRPEVSNQTNNSLQWKLASRAVLDISVSCVTHHSASGTKKKGEVIESGEDGGAKAFSLIFLVFDFLLWGDASRIKGTYGSTGK